MMVLAALARTWRHGRRDVLGWPEKLAMVAIAVLIVRVIVRFQAGMVR